MRLNVYQEMIRCVGVKRLFPSLQQIRSYQSKQQQDGQTQTEGNDLHSTVATASRYIGETITPGNADAAPGTAHCRNERPPGAVQRSGYGQHSTEHDDQHQCVTDRVVKKQCDGDQGCAGR